MYSSRSAEADRRKRQVEVKGQHYVLREYIGAAPRRGKYVVGNEANGNEDPQGFLVYQPPNSVTPPHFHETNQFQVFVDGDGKMGKHAALPVSVHYAAGHSPYGPITAGPRGVRYFTLRQRWDPGAKYMPEMRDRLQSGNQRIRLGRDIALTTTDLPGVLPETLDIFAREDDGLYATLTRLPADQQVRLTDPSDGGGQYVVVVNGGVVVDGEDFEIWSCLYVRPEDSPLHIGANSLGAEVLCLQFPRETVVPSPKTN
ncbi:MAG: hypothetical protein AAF493_01235 [Pseudomonadota bacterium]